MGFSLKKIFGGGGGSIPTFNAEPIRKMLKESATTQRDLVNTLPTQLSPLSKTFEGKSGQVGADYLKEVGNLDQRLQTNIANPAFTEQAVARRREQENRAVPQQQQAIREALAGGNRLATGRGAAMIAQPVITAAQNTSDFASELAMQNEQERQGALKTGVSMQNQAQLAKLGLDTDTIRTLFETGRGDIVQQAADLLGIEGDLSQGLFNLDVTKQNADIARAQAEQANRNALRNALIGGGSTLLGAYLGKPPTPAA